MEKNNYRLIPFDIKRAKTPSNPDGLEVVTKDATPVTIIATDFRSLEIYDNGNRRYPIVAMIHNCESDKIQLYQKDGAGREYDDIELCLKKPTPQRRMTHQELSWWLREHPEEHRELSHINGGAVFTSFGYNYNRCDDEVPEDYRIRTHGGEWREPLVDAN